MSKDAVSEATEWPRKKYSFEILLYTEILTSLLYFEHFFVSVSGTAVQISGPDTAQIGSEVSLSCSSQESNPPSIIKWTVDGVQHFATQNDNLVNCSLLNSKIS